MAVYYLVRYFTMGISVEGWTSQMLVMLAFFGLVLLSIGIMGIYLMNILNEAKKMPHYVIRREDTEDIFSWKSCRGQNIILICTE